MYRILKVRKILGKIMGMAAGFLLILLVAAAMAFAAMLWT